MYCGNLDYNRLAAGRSRCAEEVWPDGRLFILTASRLEDENRKLKQLVADLILEKVLLKRCSPKISKGCVKTDARAAIDRRIYGVRASEV